MRPLWKKLAGVTGLTALALGAACAGSTPERQATTASAADLDKADWLEKTASLLRDGEGLGPDDDVGAMLARPKEQIVDDLMGDPRFGDMVLSFAMFYLGRKIDRVKRPSFGRDGYEYAREVFAVPQALAAARAVLDGGNFFDLYSGNPPIFVQRRTPFRRPSVDAGDAGPTPTPRAQAAQALEAGAAAVEASVPTGCNRLYSAQFQVSLLLRQEGVDVALDKWFGPILGTFPSDPMSACGRPGASGADVAAKVRLVAQGVDKLFLQLEAAPLPPPVVSNLGHLLKLRVAVAGLPALGDPLTRDGFWQKLPNTSTNFNRKRAAYALKTYFCDDLTPLSLADTIALGEDGGDAGTEPHGGDPHGSKPECYACHYKLDPMAGLFRNIGRQGESFLGRGFFVFDDGVNLDAAQLDTYLGNWRGPDGAFRAGYYVQGADGRPKRHETWQASFPDDVSGLWRFLPLAPEARACLSRRLAEYVLGPKQVYDAEWLAEITLPLQSGAQSSAVVKDVIKKLVLSKTFSRHDPELGVCYDAASGAAASRPPCAVAHVLKQSCSGCHASTAARGHVDLTSWAEHDGGFGFAHVDASGRPITRRESFQKVLDALTTTDPRKRMPFQQSLADTDRVALVSWARAQLGP